MGASETMAADSMCERAHGNAWHRPGAAAGAGGAGAPQWDAQALFGQYRKRHRIIRRANPNLQVRGRGRRMRRRRAFRRRRGVVDAYLPANLEGNAMDCHGYE